MEGDQNRHKEKAQHLLLGYLGGGAPCVALWHQPLAGISASRYEAHGYGHLHGPADHTAASSGFCFLLSSPRFLFSSLFWSFFLRIEPILASSLNGTIVS